MPTVQSQDLYAYLYLRTNDWLELTGQMYNLPVKVIKIGVTGNLVERVSTYKTGEYNLGKYVVVFQIPANKMHYIDMKMKWRLKYWNSRHSNGNGATEMYDRYINGVQINTHIARLLQYLKINHKELTLDEINALNKRIDRENCRANLIERLQLAQLNRLPGNAPIATVTKLAPKVIQVPIIDKAVQYFQEHSKGLLVLMCGVGKTLIALWITMRLPHQTILIGVPSILLLNQWKAAIDLLNINKPSLLIDGSTSIPDIIAFLTKHPRDCIVITTYHSSYKVKEAVAATNIQFTMKILDEAHHLATTNAAAFEEDDRDRKLFVNILQIPATYQLALTATLKLIDPNADDSNVISNDNVEYFGNIIEQKSLSWAIVHKAVCDYKLIIVVMNEDLLEQYFTRFKITDKLNKQLFMSALVALKSIMDGEVHHLLIYVNSKTNIDLMFGYIKKLLDHYYSSNPNVTALFYDGYHSEINDATRAAILHRFKTAQQGIIVCVYCLNEGVDMPYLDGVVVAEQMTSPIRTIQSSTRCCRLNPDDPDKIGKIILPNCIINDDDTLLTTDNKTLDLLYTLAQTDESVVHKICARALQIKPDDADADADADAVTNNAVVRNNMFELVEDEALTTSIRLKTKLNTALLISYDKAKQIIANNHIRSKAQYYALCDKDARLHREPDDFYKNKFVDWIDYLGISRQSYYDYTTCKKKVAEYTDKFPIKVDHNLADVCRELAAQDPLFPACDLWTDYYKIPSLDVIISVTPKKIRFV